MIKNMGSAERIVRISLAIVVAALILMDILSGAAAIILGILAAVFLLTSLEGFCPPYLPLKLSTLKKPNPS